MHQPLHASDNKNDEGGNKVLIEADGFKHTFIGLPGVRKIARDAPAASGDKTRMKSCVNPAAPQCRPNISASWPHRCSR
jgi:hypothetical protein